MKRSLLLLFFLLLCPAPARAQNLAIRTYRVSDGLAHNNVNRIFQDAKGFLWIATYEGLSRFDGYNFITYDTDDGLGHIFTNDIVADNRGRLWAATNGGGVSRLVDEPEKNSLGQRKKFVSFAVAAQGENNNANLVNRILFDAENRLWCVTDGGIYRATSLEIADFQFERVAPSIQPLRTNAALRDSRGRLWFSARQRVEDEFSKIFQITNGQIATYEVRETETEAPTDIHTLIEDGRGRVLAASFKVVYEFVEPTAAAGRGAWRKLPLALAPAQIINIIASASDGGLWLGGNGLTRVRDERQTLYTIENGLSINAVAALHYDREGNLWIGTTSGGLSKLSGEGVVNFTVAQGLPQADASTIDLYGIVEDRAGRIYANVGCNPVEITGEDKILRLPYGEAKCSFPWLQDALGNWWFNTPRGLEFSSRPLLDLRSGTLVTDANGSAYSGVYEDAEGGIWLIGWASGKLYRLENGDPANPQVAAENFPGVQYIVRDKTSGTIWLANNSIIWRVTNGQVSELERIEGLPIIQPRRLFQDGKGRIWIGTRHHGALVTDEPNAAMLRFRRYTMADGLASDTVRAITEDDDGRIYFGTGRGIDQLDPATNTIHHFTPDEGAVSAGINYLLKDRRGRIWAISADGITRINPRGLRPTPSAPPIFINQIRVAGEELPLPETGATAIPPLELSASRNNVAVRFVGLSFQGENALRYQYKLEGVDADWGAPTAQREINYALLAPGHYRFLVRAVVADDVNVVSAQPATFEFTILRPIYLRWWFVTLAALVTIWLVYTLYRRRIARLIEIANMRTRIATDLHDDIGANLTRISLLSEVAKRQLGEDGKAGNSLSSIARISRESIASMGDIVWAISPDRDQLIDLVRKMREHADEIFTQRDIRLDFDAPAAERHLKLGAGVRRDVLLIFKEAVNNAARHSNCSQVEIDLRVEGSWLSLMIADDGEGFDASIESDGQGLVSMRRRAENLGGEFEIDSRIGQGTIVKLRAPVNRAPYLKG